MSLKSEPCTQDDYHKGTKNSNHNINDQNGIGDNETKTIPNPASMSFKSEPSNQDEDEEIRIVDHIIKKEIFEGNVVKAKITINNDEEYIVKIHSSPSNITLKDLKANMPLPEPEKFRYYIKTADKCFEEFDYDDAILPLVEDKIVVKCRSL